MSNSPAEGGSDTTRDYPICAVCPRCGCPAHTKTQPNHLVAFAKDRVCLACGTRYTPPTPVWGTVVFIAVGALLAIGCTYSLLLGVAAGSPQAVPLNAAFAVLGVLCLRYGIRSFRQQVVSAPTWSGPPPASPEPAPGPLTEERKKNVRAALVLGLFLIPLVLLAVYFVQQSLAQWRQQRKEQLAALKMIKDHGGSVDPVRLSDSELPDPEVVHLWQTEYQFTDDDLRLASCFPNVTCFNLVSRRVTDAGVRHLSRHTKLTRLWLECPQVTDQALRHLKGMTELRELSLRTTRITDVGLKELAEFKQLQSLLLGETRVTDKGVAELQRALPRCEIFR